jgi:hypothetical protein
MKSADGSGDVDVRLHPPERRRASTTLVATGSCCCCCCCVHSLGGLAGAIYGSRRKGAPDPETLTTEQAIQKDGEIARSGRYAAKVYWMALTIVGFITCVVSTIAEPREPVIGPAIIAGFLPAGQLIASVISLIYIKLRPPVRPDVCLSRLGRITLFAFLGGLLGTVGTVLCFVGMK